MTRVRVLSVAFIAMAAASAFAGTTLFGVPFGEPLPYKPGRCPDRPTVEKVCLISPESSKTSGMGRLPTKGLPPWAEHSAPDIRLGKNNQIDRLDFSIWATKEIQPDVLNSISARFGKPGRLDYGQAVNYEWSGEGIAIKYYCGPHGCVLTFMSSDYLRKIAEDQAALKAKQKAMPVSP